MENLADLAARAAQRHPAPALHVRELATLVQGSGARVPEAILLRALATEPGRFRLVDPWRGPWSTLRRRSGPAGREPSRVSGAAAPRLEVFEGPSVVPEPGDTPWSPGPAAVVLGLMRQTLVRLGWRVDESSPVDLARWYQLVLESARVRGRLTRPS